MVSSFLNFEGFTKAAPVDLKNCIIRTYAHRIICKQTTHVLYVQLYVCAWFTILRVAYLMVYIKINLSLGYLLAMRWWTHPTLFVMTLMCRSSRILGYPVLAGYTQFYQQKSCFARVPSIKTKVAHSGNKMYYFMFIVCDILTFICTWSKLWVNAVTLYAVFQYYCIASIYCNANSHWLGSIKGCPSSYSHVGYFDMFIEKKVGDFF